MKIQDSQSRNSSSLLRSGEHDTILATGTYYIYHVCSGQIKYLGQILHYLCVTFLEKHYKFLSLYRARFCSHKKPRQGRSFPPRIFHSVDIAQSPRPLLFQETSRSLIFLSLGHLRQFLYNHTRERWTFYSLKYNKDV